jgi:hypothetical protein
LPGTVDLTLVQNKDAVFGRGMLTSFGTTKDLSASGWTAKDVLYLDMVDMQNMMLYRCTLTMSEDNLSGSFNAYDAQGGPGRERCREAARHRSDRPNLLAKNWPR